MLLSLILTLGVAVLAVKVFNVCTHGELKSKKSLVGKTVLITGGNLGVGFEAAMNFASRGCRLIIASRSADRKTCKRITEITGNENVMAMQLNLASFQSVRHFVDEFKRTEGQLDILVNNAATAGWGATKTVDGINVVMQTNHFGPFLLTHLLLDLLKRSPDGRIVFTSSVIAYFHKLQLDLLQDPYAVSGRIGRRSELRVLAGSRACSIIVVQELAARLANTHIVVHACHPGFIYSPLAEFIFRSTFSLFEMITVYLLCGWMCKRVRQAADVVVETALRDDQPSGGFFVDNHRFARPAIADDDVFVNQFWRISERTVRLPENLKLPRIMHQEPPQQVQQQ